MEIDKNSKVAVIGEGSWATAIVKILLSNVDKLNWYIRSDESVKQIKETKRNPNFLRSVVLQTEKLDFYTTVKETVKDADIVFLVVPSAYLKVTIEGTSSKDFADKFIVSAIKGIVPDEYLTVCNYMQTIYNVPRNLLGVVSGPSHAEEIALERLTYLTVSAENYKNAEHISSLFQNTYLRTTLSDDIFGTEYASVMKNIMAVASGICHGMGYGDNFQAVLISNSIREIKRFVDVVNPLTRDIQNSAYLGDLLVTAYSTFSRNRTFGNMIGKGYSVKAAQFEMNMVAEGYFAVKGIFEINKKYNVDLPITNAVYNILYEKITPRMEMKILADLLR